ncbi:BSD domain [Trypanosoma vivax]|nr:BSD domain [Trypanosoma vivax]
MQVECNGVPHKVEFCGPTVSLGHLSGDGEVKATLNNFAFSEITQLLRSRRDPCSAKLVVGQKAFLMRFVSLEQREQFIQKVQSCASESGGTEKWVASTICHAAVDVGILTESELEALMSEELQRGVVMALDAIGSLVDPVTFRLRPITEQLTNDIFRQIPVLAKIFERNVTDEETMQQFWEVVVRKYFCFSRTFLEDEVHALEAKEGGGTTSSPAAGPETLTDINVASGQALPKVRSQTTEVCSLTPSRVLDDSAPQLMPHIGLFRGRPLPLPYAAAEKPCAVQPPLAHVAVSEPPPVSRALPKESASREVLELLKKFWSSDANQKKALRSKFDDLKKKNSKSILQKWCLQRVDFFLEELGNKRDR